ncbi:hypothetical protein ACS386_07840 [Flavobacteriaceae bacterium LMO-SS05]
MEIGKLSEKKDTLILTKAIFNILINKVIEHFLKKYNIENNYKETQLFGFGNYDTNQPNLKDDFESIIKGYVNGKYLYNKNREASDGNPFIKISREYKYVFFNYLGYKDVHEFIDQDFLVPSQKSKQLELLYQENNIEDYYYVAYYFGEDEKMNKGQAIVYKQWKNIEMKYIYKDEFGNSGIYSYYGKITDSGGFVFFDTKYYSDGKRKEGAKFTFFIGKSSPNERVYLVGVYSGFDKYDNAIAGKMILKKFESKNAMEKEISSTRFDPILSQELSKKRIVVESVIRKDPLLFSSKSPFAKILKKISNKYLVKFHYEDKIHEIKLIIERHHLNIKCLNNNLIIENDKVNLLSNGQILNLEFSINGLFRLQNMSIYIKAFDLIKKDNIPIGQYTAVDINNTILSGSVEFEIIE